MDTTSSSSAKEADSQCTIFWPVNLNRCNWWVKKISNLSCGVMYILHYWKISVDVVWLVWVNKLTINYRIKYKVEWNKQKKPAIITIIQTELKQWYESLLSLTRNILSNNMSHDLFDCCNLWPQFIKPPNHFGMK